MGGGRPTAMLVLALTGCGSGAAEPAPAPNAARAFRDQWYAGQAELTRYRLEQSRYGALHEGDAVLIFVTEDFLAEAQVKDEGRGSGGPSRSVLKLNFTREFTTGIYPYTTMTSVFTPVDRAGAGSLKVSSAVQEWCGHTYAQLNRRGERLRGHVHSYFEGEADRDVELALAPLEDELWTRIRIEPAALPLGEIGIVPGLQYARLSHRPLRVERASAELAADASAGRRVYRLAYRDLPRRLTIVFEDAFPHAILEWEEHGGPGEPVTRAVRTSSLRLDYWRHNAPADRGLRERLGLR
jgi:hypothetical protein